jgi:HEAT repeat protein
VGDRFRLIYLKSTGLEKSTLDEPSSSHDPQEISKMVPPTPECNLPETFSSQVLLKQVNADLEHPDPKVRISAIQYLEKSGPSIALPLLEEMLSDGDPEVRVQALASLVKFRDPNLIPFLKKYLKDRDPRVRMVALRGIFRNEERIDLNLLLQFLSDESPWVRRKVATLLGWTQMEGVFPILIELSKDQDSSVRRAALFSLTTLYPEESEDRLLGAMTDSDPDLRKWAGSTLERMAARPLKGRRVSLPNRG